MPFQGVAGQTGCRAAQRCLTLCIYYSHWTDLTLDVQLRPRWPSDHLLSYPTSARLSCCVCKLSKTGLALQSQRLEGKDAFFNSAWAWGRGAAYITTLCVGPCWVLMSHGNTATFCSQPCVPGRFSSWNTKVKQSSYSDEEIIQSVLRIKSSQTLTGYKFFGCVSYESSHPHQMILVH